MAIGKGFWRSKISFGFRAAVIGQTLAVAGQALLAGMALSGSANAAEAHMKLGGELRTEIERKNTIFPEIFGSLARLRWVFSFQKCVDLNLKGKALEIRCFRAVTLG